MIFAVTVAVIRAANGGDGKEAGKSAANCAAD